MMPIEVPRAPRFLRRERETIGKLPSTTGRALTHRSVRQICYELPCGPVASRSYASDNQRMVKNESAATAHRIRKSLKKRTIKIPTAKATRAAFSPLSRTATLRSSSLLNTSFFHSAEVRERANCVMSLNIFRIATRGLLGIL